MKTLHLRSHFLNMIGRQTGYHLQCGAPEHSVYPGHDLLRGMVARRNRVQKYLARIVCVGSTGTFRAATVRGAVRAINYYCARDGVV